MSRETLLADLLREARARGWPLARLDGAADPAAPFEGADADLLAAWRPWSDWRRLVEDVAGRRGWRVVNVRPTGGVMAIFVADPAAGADDPAGAAQLDFHRALSARGVPFVDPRRLFAMADETGGALRLPAATARGVRVLEKRLVHGGGPPATDIPSDLTTEAFAGGRWSLGRAGFVALRRRPGLALRLSVAKIADAVRRFIRPSGVLVTVSGPDGAGKSSLIAGLTAAIPRRLAPDAQLFHTRPFLLPRFGVSPPPPPPGPASPAPPGQAESWVRWLTACADYWLGGMLWVRPALCAGRIVVFDRYVADYQAAPLRRGTAVPPWALALMARMAPRPDLALILTAPPDELIRRKDEATPEEAARQNRAYAEAAAASGAVTLDSGTYETKALIGSARALLIEVMAAHAHSGHP